MPDDAALSNEAALAGGVEGEDSVESSSSSGGGTGLGYNSEIRVGDEFQAEIPSLLEGRPSADEPEHADLIFHPDRVC